MRKKRSNAIGLAGNADAVNATPITDNEIRARYLRDKITDFEATVEAAARDLCTSVFMNVHDRLMGALDGMGGMPVPVAKVVKVPGRKPKRTPGKLSPEARARIVEAQRKRWAKVRREKKAAEAVKAAKVAKTRKAAKPVKKAVRKTSAKSTKSTKLVTPAEITAAQE